VDGVEVAEALRTRSFWLYCLILALFGISGAAVNLHLVPFLLTGGFKAGLAAWVLSTYYIGATVSKPILGAATDRVGVRGGICFALLMMGGSCLLLPRVSDHRVIFTLAATYGFGIGGPVALMPLLGVEAFGLRRYGTLGSVGLGFHRAGRDRGLFRSIWFLWSGLHLARHHPGGCLIAAVCMRQCTGGIGSLDGC